VTWAAAAFTLALLAPAELLAPTAGTVRFMRIANSAFDRYTKSPDPAQQKWMRRQPALHPVRVLRRVVPQYAADIGDAGFRAH